MEGIYFKDRSVIIVVFFFKEFSQVLIRRRPFMNYTYNMYNSFMNYAYIVDLYKLHDQAQV